VLGYRGSNDVLLAVERGEIEGGYGLWSDMTVRKADWLSEHLINVLFQVGDRPDADYPDVPLATSLAPTEEGRAIIGLFSAPSFVGRSFFTTQGVPADRVAILRQAFAETLDDPHFRADAQRMGLEIDPMTGPELQDKVRALMQTPKDLIAKADKARQP
jgi:tripartite-type tricarboxylate transporter receptor subunit TctC